MTVNDNDWRANDHHERTILDIGCGNNKRDSEAIGLDIRGYDAVDVIADLEDPDGLPFPDNQFGEIHAFSILEHVDDLPAVMRELHRISEPGARIRGKVPHWKDRNMYIDPTHEQFFDAQTFEFWDPRTELGQRGYFEVEFYIHKAERVKRVKFWRSRPIEFELEVRK